MVYLFFHFRIICIPLRVKHFIGAFHVLMLDYDKNIFLY